MNIGETVMKNFEYYIKVEEKVRKVSPNISEAKGLMENGVKDLERTKEIKLSEDNASFVFKNIYDCIRSILQAFLSKEGYKSYSHEAIIAFNMQKGNISKFEAYKLDKFRQLRNDIEYRGAKATID